MTMSFLADELQRVPVLGEQAKRASRRIPSARAAERETFIAPVLLPKLPSRFYFLFQEVTASYRNLTLVRCPTGLHCYPRFTELLLSVLASGAVALRHEGLESL